MTNTDLANMALSRLGEPRITDIAENSPAAISCRENLELVRDSLLRAHPWNFAMGRATLTAGAAPPFGWEYSYPLPADLLRVLTFNGVQAAMCAADFTIEGGKLLAHVEEAKITYVRRVTDPTLFDPLFVEVLVLRLASAIALDVTSSTEKRDAMEVLADQRLKGATFVDAGERRVQLVDGLEGVRMRHYGSVGECLQSPIWSSGTHGWSPVLAAVTHSNGKVLQITNWIGGSGDKPSTGYVGANGIVSSINDATLIPDGLSGSEGDDGWTPIFAVESDVERRVLKVVDWTGGQGTKPAVNVWVGATGFVTNIASAVNIRGPQGLSGPSGNSIIGQTGPAGPQGPAGPAGPEGPAGADGDSAYEVAVANGFVGTEEQWLDSLIGPVGDTGPVGPEGPAGPQGPQGEPGSAVYQGDPGPAGPEGPAGPAGPEGPAGPMGPQGPAGSDASMVGPQGPEGPMGPAGPQGPQGEPGSAVYQGDPGPQGPQGPEGPMGPAGPQGPEGPQGPQGPEGPQGPQGPAGTGTVNSVDISGSDGIEVDSGSPITSSGTIALGINASTLKSHLSLGSVEDTALSTWAGSTSITTLGTIATGSVPAANVSGLGDAATKNTGTTAGTVAAGDHTHAQLHDAVTVSDSSSIDLTLTGQQISAAAIFGTTSGTVCQGNDSRLSDSRTPTSHTHGNITNAGAIGSTAGLPIKTGTSGVLEAGAFGTSAGQFAEGNHSHSAFTGDSGSGGVAGFVPAPAAGDAAAGKYLDADGTWTVPPAGGGGVSDGDKGDITVSASGATWTIDNDAVTYAKLQNISATSRILGRKTAAAGDAEECTLSEVLDFVGSAAQGDILYRGASSWTRLAAGTSGHYLKTLGSGANPEWAAVSASGGGTKTYARFTPLDAQPPATNFATLDTRNSIAVLDFDGGSTNEETTFVGILPEGADVSSGLKVRIHWMATSATSGNCRWGVQFEKAGTDLGSDSFDAATEAHSATNGTSGIETVTEITATSIDSLTAGDRFRIKVYRDASDTTNDTMTGDAELIAVEIRSAV